MFSKIVRFVSRKDARETWWYERAVILAIEALCLVATLIAAPWGWPALLIAARAPFHLRKAATDHAARSGAVRKRELAEAMGLDEAKLACAEALEREALIGQILSGLNPLIDLIATAILVRGSGKSLDALAIVGCIIALVRFALPLAYGAWRKAYRAARPIDTTKLVAEQLVGGFDVLPMMPPAPTFPERPIMVVEESTKEPEQYQPKTSYGRGDPAEPYDGDDGTPPSYRPANRTNIIEMLAMYGADGWDEEGFFDALDSEGIVREEAEVVLEELRREGLIDAIGCSWIGLSNAAWLEYAKEKVRLYRLRDHEDIIEAVVDMLVTNSRVREGRTTSDNSSAQDAENRPTDVTAPPVDAKGEDEHDNGDIDHVETKETST